MDGRRVFTLDSDRFPLEKVRELAHHLHQHHQHYIVMVDPAVSVNGKQIQPKSIQKKSLLGGTLQVDR